MPFRSHSLPRTAARTRAAVLAVVSFGLLPFAGGCGGNSNSLSANFETTNVTTTFAWPALASAETVEGRAIAVPATAQSFIITLRLGNPDTGGSIDFPPVNRDTTQSGAYTQTWTSPSKVRTGDNQINIRFYSLPQKSNFNVNSDKPVGTVVADFNQNVTINSDGTGLPTVATP